MQTTFLDAPNYASSNFPDPRPFQITAHESLRDGARAGHRCQVVMAPTGAGKLYLGLRIAHEALKRGKRAIFICDRITLINQASKKADEYGLSAHGIFQSGHWRANRNMPFQIASAQTLARRGIDHFDTVIIDECFPGHTLIDTPLGQKRIDSLSCGELIYNSCGESQILSVFSKVVYATLKIRISDGTIIECTADHPIFTDMGWRSASSLGVGTRLFRRKDVQEVWGGFLPRESEGIQREDDIRSRGVVQRTRMLREILRKEIKKSDAQIGSARKSICNSSFYGPQTSEAGRERAWYDESSSGDDGAFRCRLESGICRKNTEKQYAGIPASLQNRHSESRHENSNRIGRNEPLCSIEASTGQEKRCIAEKPWVESIKIVEYPGGINVYNLRVDDHPSYFANGVLVHNCHAQLKVTTDYIKNSGAHCVGLSATPFSKGLGLVYSNLINATTMHELVEQGTLVPMRVLSCTTVDMRGAATSGGEWTENAAAERGMEIVGDVVNEWLEHASGGKTIGFGPTIAYCEELREQFIAAGVRAEVFTSETKADEREALLAEYAKPDSKIRVLLSVEALAKGFDVPDVACILDIRPLRKSLSTAIQMWGRGARSHPGKDHFKLLDFSGNIIRFKEDFEDIYFNGLDVLDAGEKLDKTIRRDDDEEKEPAKGCPACGSKPFAKRCMACGFAIVKPSLIESVPGEMVEIMIGKRKLADDSRHLYEQMCAYARGNSAPEKQAGRAAHLYKDIMGTYPPKSWRFESTPSAPITAAVLNKIKQKNIAYSKARR
ncbi:MAG: helicase-related protein [Mariprofundaceae bacterium]|jgi:DNA repair protein RadD|nr:helicase-related protein [Mariprofundaceae bacterium]